MPTHDHILNPEILLHRDAAVSALRLSQKQMEQGLALHRSSIVIDTYGFSAFASPESALVQAAVKSGLAPSSVRQIELQSGMTRMADDAHQKALFIEAWRASGVTCVMRNSGEEGNSVERMLPRLAHNTYAVDHLAEVMQRIVEPIDIRQAKQKNLFGFCHTTNGVPLPVSWETAVEALRFIAVFRQLGVRMMHLTYNRQNLLGGGCAESSSTGLSDLGRQVVSRMNHDGVIVDLAHTGEQTSLDVAACTTRPVVVSHGSCRDLHEHCRGKRDAVFKAVAQTGGLVGICCIPDFLGGSGDIQALLDHIDHAVSVVGDEHVAIGTDVAMVLPPNADDLAKGKAGGMGPQAQRYESFWPADAFDANRWGKAHMTHSLAWTNWPLFTAGLVQRGYRDEQIQRIIGLNMLRVLESQTLPASATSLPTDH